jgi:hypothetical protein
MELDGEPISIEQSSPSDRSTGLNQREDFPYFNDSFNNADGMLNHADSMGRIKMVAASAAQNTPDYFDQDTFYPADGIRGIAQSAGSNVKDFFSKESGAQRRKLRGERRTAKTAEIQSRADLNKAAGQQNPADAEIAKSLGGSDKTQMSTTTKVLIGVGALLVVGALAYFVINKKK